MPFHHDIATRDLGRLSPCWSPNGASPFKGAFDDVERPVHRSLDPLLQGACRATLCSDAFHVRAHPPRTREMMACKTSRLVCVRGYPPRFAEGLRGSRMLHAASVTSCGEDVRLRTAFGWALFMGRRGTWGQDVFVLLFSHWTHSFSYQSAISGTTFFPGISASGPEKPCRAERGLVSCAVRRSSARV
jgi:hypothetical protein